MGIFQRIFGRGTSSRTNESMSAERATEIIQKYGAFLESDAPSPGCVADASKLPFPKNLIKQALLIGLRSTTDPKMREILRVGYLHLADWQEGVGDSDQGIDVSGIDPDEDPLKLAERVLAQSEGHEKWSPVAHGEQRVLAEELQREGLW